MANAVRRYAEGTKVPVDATQNEMRSLLRKHGASEFALYEGPTRQAVQFTLKGHAYRFDVERPSREWAEAEVRLKSWQSAYNTSVAKRMEGEWQRRWRARLMWLKSTLEFAFGEEDQLPFLLGAYAVLENGQTLGAAIAAGNVPLLDAG